MSATRPCGIPHDRPVTSPIWLRTKRRNERAQARNCHPAVDGRSGRRRKSRIISVMVPFPIVKSIGFPFLRATPDTVTGCWPPVVTLCEPGTIPQTGVVAFWEELRGERALRCRDFQQVHRLRCAGERPSIAVHIGIHPVHVTSIR